MLGATVRRVKRRLMVPAESGSSLRTHALGARDSNAGPEVLFRAQFAMRSLLLCAGLGGGDG
jgi:hypothetical protein